MTTFKAHSHSITLYREVNHRLRYYKLSLTLNLFGEYIFQREYGSIKSKRPTRVIQDYFSSFAEAYSTLELKIKEKSQRGYREKNVFITDKGKSP